MGYVTLHGHPCALTNMSELAPVLPPLILCILVTPLNIAVPGGLPESSPAS